MQKADIGFADFLKNVHPAHTEYLNELHGFMTENGCTFKIETAKNGHVLSYLHGKKKKTVANYVFRKSGLVVRIYADNIGKYGEILNTMPERLKADAGKAPVCRRLIDITKCNSRCPMGYVFELDGVTHKKCRYGAFMFGVDFDAYDAIRGFIVSELRFRNE